MTQQVPQVGDVWILLSTGEMFHVIEVSNGSVVAADEQGDSLRWIVDDFSSVLCLVERDGEAVE